MQRIIAGLFAAPWLVAAASAQDMPPRKAGLWQIEMSMADANMPKRPMSMCIDAATDAEMYKLGMNASQGMCDRHDVNRSGDTVTIDSVCAMGSSRITTHAVSVFTGDTAYHTDINSKMDPPLMGRASSTMAQDAKWTGPCPPDMRPGDIDMGNGVKMNVKQMLGGK